MKDLYFFATRNDLEPIIKEIEARYQLKYVPIAKRADPNFIIYDSLLEYPNIGVVAECFYFSFLNPVFFIFPREQEVAFATLTAPNGELSYAVNFLANPSAIKLFIGGVCQDHQALLCGVVAPYKEGASPLYRNLGKVFQNMLQQMNPKKINPILVYPGYHYYIGTEAARLAQQGYRLVQSNYREEEFLRTPGVF